MLDLKKTKEYISVNKLNFAVLIVLILSVISAVCIFTDNLSDSAKEVKEVKEGKPHLEISREKNGDLRIYKRDGLKVQLDIYAGGHKLYIDDCRIWFKQNYHNKCLDEKVNDIPPNKSDKHLLVIVDQLDKSIHLYQMGGLNIRIRFRNSPDYTYHLDGCRIPNHIVGYYNRCLKRYAY